MTIIGRLGIATVVTVLLSFAACTSDDATGGGGEVARGGVLRLGAVRDSSTALDPMGQQDQFPEDLYMCCLLRNLVALSEVTEEGPIYEGDLAKHFTVTEDGLEYRFTLRPDAMFGPPLSRPVTADDVLATFERALHPDTAAYNVDDLVIIEGAQKYFDEDADMISGIEVVNERELVIRLVRPSPLFLYDLPFPLPRELLEAQPKEVGRYLVSTGPYMIEGAAQLDLSADPASQEPHRGYKPGQSLVLVRNPDWKRASDPFRGDGAYVDRIEVTIGGTPEDYGSKIERDELDIMVDEEHPAQMLRTFSTDPELEDQLHVWPFYATQYASMTLAAPPFDDVHVRRAANWVVDRSAIVRIRGSEINGTPTDHLIPPGVLGDELDAYAPYQTDGDTGSLEMAKEQMRQSKYDTDGDGVCDVPACTDVPAVGPPDQVDAAVAQEIAARLAEIGIELDLQLIDERFEILAEPSNRIAFNTSAAWDTQPFDGEDMGRPVFGSGYIGPRACCNEVLTGATPEQLEEWGFPVDSVPDLDDEISRCEGIPLGPDRVDCWIAFDKMISEEIVPWIFLVNETQAKIVSSRVTQVPFSVEWQEIRYDQVDVVND